MKLRPNFTKKELECSHCGKCEMKDRSLDLIQKLRNQVNHSLKINSAYRCEIHNRNVGGTKNSQHLAGTAFDVDTTGWSAKKKFTFLKSALSIGFKGIGIYANFIHIDTREYPAMWYGK